MTISHAVVIWLQYDTIREFDVDSKAEYYLAHVAKTRSQAVARIADRTASQHILGSGDVIGHETI